MLCRKCGKRKPAAEFYHYRPRVCKVCVRLAVRQHRRDTPSVQAYDRARAKTPERRAASRAVTIRWRKDHPDRYRAETAVSNAVRDGRLIKEPCQVCRTWDNVHGHHPDYSRPLEVEWLCALHHHRGHAEDAR